MINFMKMALCQNQNLSEDCGSIHSVYQLVHACNSTKKAIWQTCLRIFSPISNTLELQNIILHSENKYFDCV